MKNLLKQLAKSVLTRLGLTAAPSASDAAIQNKTFEAPTTTLILSNEEMNNIMKILKSLEESGLLITSISKTNKNEAREQKKKISQYGIRYIRC